MSETCDARDDVAPAEPAETEPDWDGLERILDYRFKDRSLLRRAMTHSSSTADKNEDNERLEFFGDAVLDFLICERLFETQPLHREGELTEIKSLVVRRPTLAEAARAIGLRPYLILGKGISGRYRLPVSIHANAYEALVAALYLDGGMAVARRFVFDSLGEALDAARLDAGAENYKSLLQQFLQGELRTVPEYRVVQETGPDHGKVFDVAVRVGGVERGHGKGPSKKAAEQAAARDALRGYGKLTETAGENNAPA